MIRTPVLVKSSISEKKKKSHKTSKSPLQNKLIGGISNYNYEQTPYSKMMLFKPSTFETSKFIINEKKTYHEDYNYNMPPENLTYEKLLKTYSGDLLNKKAIDLQGNAEEFAKEIAIKIIEKEGDFTGFDNYNIDTVNSVFIEKIKNKINQDIKNKELLRKDLWNILYTSHYGYVPKYIEKYGDKINDLTIGEAIQDELSITKKPRAKSIGGKYKNFLQYILNGGGPRDHSPGKPPPPPQLPVKYFNYYPGFIISLWNILIRMLNRPLKMLEGPPLTYNHSDIMNELPGIKSEIINSLTLPKDKDKIKLEFNYVDYNIAKDYITNSIFLRRKIESLNSNTLYSNYANNEIERVIYKPFDNLYIYGMQNPEQFDRTKLLSTMFFLLEKMKITDFVDLQDCDGGTYKLNKNIRENCNPYDRGAEREMFNLAVKVLIKEKKINNQEIKRSYKNIKDIVDMTSGSLLAWNEINNLPAASDENRMIIHCFAGKGRTGTTLLFLRLRDINDIRIESRLNKKHLGFHNIIDLINNLSKLFNPSYNISSQNQEEAENKLNNDYWKQVIKEVFKIEKIWHIKLLRQRLNRIFYFLAKKYNVKIFYLYAIPSQEYKYFQQIFDFDYNETQYTDMMSFFSEPFRVNIDWDNFNSQSLRVHQDYIDGII